MSDWDVVDEPQDREDLERVNNAWNGETRGPLDKDDQRVLDRLAMLAGEIKPPPAFVSRLREQLMSTTVLPSSASLSAEKILELPTPRTALPSKHVRRWSWSGLASAAVILAILGGVFAVVLNNRGGGDPPKATEFSALAPNAAAGSPEASPSASEPGAGMPAYTVAHAGVDPSSMFPSGFEGPYGAALYNVRIDPGQTSEMTGDSNPDVKGLVIDFVADGTYVGTFENGATVFRGYRIQGSPVEYIEPGGTAEVQKGDSVLYQYGTSRMVSNPLFQTPLRYESVIITNAAITVSPVTSGGAYDFEASALFPVSEDPVKNLDSSWYFELQQTYPVVLNPERYPLLGENQFALFDGVITYFQNFEYRIVVSTGNRG